jgi:hypothetical protein
VGGGQHVAPRHGWPAACYLSKGWNGAVQAADPHSGLLALVAKIAKDVGQSNHGCLA